MDTKELTDAEKWLLQAKNDLDWGRYSLAGKFWAQTCFISQQIAEKSLKAILFNKGYDLIKTHSAKIMIQKLGINGDLEESAKILDQYYITTRYPDSVIGGPPFETFTEKQAIEALSMAKQIFEKAQELFKEENE